MIALFSFLFGLTVIFNSSHAYRALVVYPMPSRSHGILGDAVVKQLLKDGNEVCTGVMVVYATCYEYKNPPPSLRLIDISSNKEVIPAQAHSIVNMLENKIITTDTALVLRIMVSLVEKTLEAKGMQELINDPKEHFDVVIVNWMFSDILASLAPLFGCPLIWMSPVEVNARVLRLIDEMPSPAYSASPLATNAPPFTYIQRLQELGTRLLEAYVDYMYYDKMQSDVYDKHIVPRIIARGRQPPSFQELRFNASMILSSSHVSMGQSLRLPQNYKPLGGFHIDENVQPLPENLKKIMDAAKDGVIYFSMGSNLKSKELPIEIKQNLLKMFGELKQTVLWKFEEDLPNRPKNVHILKWAPQPSILSHPNCILFITHGGLLSTTETIHYGIPVIGIPIFGDQFVNVNIAVKKGFARRVDLTYNVAKDLGVAIKEIISNPMYKQTAKQLSYVYHNRPMKPIQELSHWVRHVVETRGALHLRSPALKVPLYQRLFLDVIAIFVVVLLGLLRFLKFACARVCSKKLTDKNKKNK